VLLRNFHHSVVSQHGDLAAAKLGLLPDSGIFLMLLTLTAVVWTDTGAYFGGRFYGKRKLAPRISPNKSVEGAVCGVLAGVAGAAAVKAVFDVFWPDLSRALGWEMVPVFGLAISLIAVLGDLVESLLKRDAATKDAGRLLPGMGGMLDRIDAPLLAIPLMYYMLLFYVFLQVRGT
jgi:phosphatidate cytidylyltransferase